MNEYMYTIQLSQYNMYQRRSILPTPKNANQIPTHFKSNLKRRNVISHLLDFVKLWSGWKSNSNNQYTCKNLKKVIRIQSNFPFSDSISYYFFSCETLCNRTRYNQIYNDFFQVWGVFSFTFWFTQILYLLHEVFLKDVLTTLTLCC